VNDEQITTVNYEEQFKEWWSTISPISTKQTTSSQLKQFNTKKKTTTT